MLSQNEYKDKGNHVVKSDLGNEKDFSSKVK